MSKGIRPNILLCKQLSTSCRLGWKIQMYGIPRKVVRPGNMDLTFGCTVVSKQHGYHEMYCLPMLPWMYEACWWPSYISTYRFRNNIGWKHVSIPWVKMMVTYMLHVSDDHELILMLVLVGFPQPITISRCYWCVTLNMDGRIGWHLCQVVAKFGVKLKISLLSIYCNNFNLWFFSFLEAYCHDTFFRSGVWVYVLVRTFISFFTSWDLPKNVGWLSRLTGSNIILVVVIIVPPKQLCLWGQPLWVLQSPSFQLFQVISYQHQISWCCRYVRRELEMNCCT